MAPITAKTNPVAPAPEGPGLSPWRRPAANPYLLALLLALAVTLPFAGKAVHIDDTHYLAMAEQILKDPWRPYDFVFNWIGKPTPALEFNNNPPLFPYYLALAIWVGGRSDLWLHLAAGVFPVLAALGFAGLARRFTRWPGWATAFFVLNPGFMVSGNLMLDIPTLALLVWTVLLTLKGMESRVVPDRPEASGGRAAAGRSAGKARRTGRTARARAGRGAELSTGAPSFSGIAWFAAAGLVFAAAIMVKYTAVVLAPALLLLAWRRRERGVSMVLAVPIVVLALWAWHNLHFHGQVHFLNLPDLGGTAGLTYIPARRLYHVLTALGTIFFLGFPVLIALWWGRPGSRAPLLTWAAGLLGSAAASGTFMFVSFHYPTFLAAQSLVWAFNGAAALAVWGMACWGWHWTGKWYGHPPASPPPALDEGGEAHPARPEAETGSRDPEDDLFLACWFSAVLALVLIAAPFVALRHLLPGLPALVLLAIRQLESADIRPIPRRPALAATAAVSAVIALAAAFSDYQYADLHRRLPFAFAKRLQAPGRTLWTMGQWGWMHYAALAGLKDLSQHEHQAKRGDLVVAPFNVGATAISDDMNKRFGKMVRQNFPGTLPIRLMSHDARAQFYGQVFGMPLSFTRAPMTTIVVTQVAQDP